MLFRPIHVRACVAFTVSDSRGGKGKSGGPEDDPDSITPINQSVAMAIAGNPFNTLARNALLSMASMVEFYQFIHFFYGVTDKKWFMLP